jgi:hypothetical protein
MSIEATYAQQTIYLRMVICVPERGIISVGIKEIYTVPTYESMAVPSQFQQDHSRLCG